MDTLFYQLAQRLMVKILMMSSSTQSSYDLNERQNERMYRPETTFTSYEGRLRGRRGSWLVTDIETAIDPHGPLQVCCNFKLSFTAFTHTLLNHLYLNQFKFQPIKCLGLLD